MEEQTLHINQFANNHWSWIEDMGWHGKRPLESIALIASEVGELANEYRGDEPGEEAGSELADIILRCLDFAVQYNIDIETELIKKYNKNILKGNFKNRKV